MAKKLTIKEKQKAALHQRVNDICNGAGGRVMENDDWLLSADLSRAVPVLQETFDPEEKQKFIWASRNLDHYENARTITDFLFTNGIRA
jgi:hypothetical protein